MTYAMNTTLGYTTFIVNKNEDDNSFCTIEDESSRTLTLTNQTIPGSDYIAVLLVAHHKGEGAYMKIGNRSTLHTLQTDTSRCRAQNISDSGLFCAEPSEDTINWVTRNNFLSTYMQTQCAHISSSQYANTVVDDNDGSIETE